VLLSKRKNTKKKGLLKPGNRDRVGPDGTRSQVLAFKVFLYPVSRILILSRLSHSCLNDSDAICIVFDVHLSAPR